MRMREIYFQEGIRHLPRILELVDRNRLSPTYGCFDRSYWHYRTSDFPSGMYQECVLPLAMAYHLHHPENPFYKEARLKELAEAGIDFARRSSHRDGSCDDYFPFERASGAAAFSLYACTEAALLLDLESPEFVKFFKKRGKYLAGPGFEESGILSNHKALIVLALYNVFLATKDSFFKTAAEDRRDDLLGLQKGEGWFPEYEGCDPGYLTFTIDFLAKYFAKSGDEKVRGPLRRAVEFAVHFVHPDGSYGGEYGSRNTFHFVPHGFELAHRFVPAAGDAADLFLKSVQTGTRSYLEDDRIFCHYAYNYLQSYQDYSPRKKAEAKDEFPLEEVKVFKEAGLLVKRSPSDYAVVSLAKGGAMKVFQEKKLVYNDGGLVGMTREGKKFTSQIPGDFKYEILKDKIVIEGHCHLYEDLIFSPFKFIFFRAFLIFLGRFFPANWVRRALQKKAILGKTKFPLRFRKEIDFPAFKKVSFHLFLEKTSDPLRELWIGSDPTFIYVATSRPYEPGALMPWISLASVLPSLNGGHAEYSHSPS